MIVPNNAIMLIAIIRIANVNVREVKVRRSSRARSVRCSQSWRTMKSVSARAPTARGSQPKIEPMPPDAAPRLLRP